MPTIERISIIIVIIVTMNVLINLEAFPTAKLCQRITEGSGPFSTFSHLPQKLNRKIIDIIALTIYAYVFLSTFL